MSLACAVCVGQLNNRLFEELAMDVYDEVDRRENDAGESLTLALALSPQLKHISPGLFCCLNPSSYLLPRSKNRYISLQSSWYDRLLDKKTHTRSKPEFKTMIHKNISQMIHVFKCAHSVGS